MTAAPVPVPRPGPAQPWGPPAVVVAATRPAADAAVRCLAREDVAAVAVPLCARDLALRCAGADQVYVVDPGRVRAWGHRARVRLATGDPTTAAALGAPMRAAERIALLGRLRHHRGRVRWLTAGVDAEPSPSTSM